MAFLDRRITLHIQAEGHRDDRGVYVPGPVTDVEVWAQVTEGGQSDVLFGQALIVVSRAVFSIRWRADVAATPVSRLGLTFDGQSWDCETVTNFADRHRFLQIAAIAGYE